jgi:Co/Zn/Cd efflux system component
MKILIENRQHNTLILFRVFGVGAFFLEDNLNRWGTFLHVLRDVFGSLECVIHGEVCVERCL